jgi:hypothetical protein
MIQLPEGIIKATHRNPRTMLIYSKPKQGKTTILSGLEGVLLIDTEKGSDFVDAMKIQVDSFNDLREVAGLIWHKGWDETTQKYNPPYKYIAVDTLTRIDEWSEIEGTLKYMDKPQGKSFNREGEIKNGVKLPVNHPEFETVHDIGGGYGYKHSREVVTKFFESFNNLAPHIIYMCHVKDKFVGTSISGAEIMTKEINLTGKLKDIIASKVDTIAYGQRDKDKFSLKFAGDTGSRSAHLSGKTIIVSEKTESGVMQYHWDEIFLK